MTSGRGNNSIILTNLSESAVPGQPPFVPHTSEYITGGGTPLQPAGQRPTPRPAADFLLLYPTLLHQNALVKPSELFDLSGEVAVVMGATGVLGGALAPGLAEAGAKVAVLGRNSARCHAP